MSEVFDRLSNLSPKRLALLAMELQDRLDAAERPSQPEPIAVIGIGCRLPGGADSADAYWRLLLDGVDAVDEIPASRWDVDHYYDPDPDVPGKMATRWAGLLDDIDRFEPQLFGISPREAQMMDPQQRLLLEVAWETLEHAGIAPDAVHGSNTGVYVGVCNMDYLQLLMDGDESQLDIYMSTGNAASVASGRLSYVLGMQGPAITIDTACSSSLVAVHTAVRALRSGDCRMALAGGVNVILSPETTIALSRAKMMASDGRCKSFDSRADGFVRGEGCGLVALKKLSDARADGDRVLAVIRGSAINQDGRSNGLTAPNGPSQVAVIRAALADAGVEPADVGYVETHGTGTSLGDPIEAQALGAALSPGRDPGNRVRIGSAKSNLGHLESAAGVAGLIKLVLTVQHGEIPPLLHHVQANPLIPWGDLPIAIVTSRTTWTGGTTRIGGVSSFGFSGTNAHLIVESVAADPVIEQVPEAPHLVKLSARTPEALAELVDAIGTSLAADPDVSIADVARTLDLGRSDLAHRLVAVASDTGELGAELAAWTSGADSESVVTGVAATRAPDVAFLFTGHGSQYPGMGRELYDAEPVFRSAVDRCGELLAPLIDRALIDVLYGDDSELLLGEMRYAQPAVFAVEYALAELWRARGVVPAVVAGHSVGEYVAAVVAGAMSVDDGIELVAARGRLMSSLPPNGAMATVFADESTVATAIEGSAGRVSIAAINGPESIALSGEAEALDVVLDRLRQRGIEVRPLAIPVAAHSPQIDPILDEFEAVARRVTFRQPTIDVVSGMSGAVAVGDDLVSASYWRRHLRQPVRFADAFRTIHDRGVRTFVEIGPHPTLLNMARHIVPEHECRWLPSLRSGRDARWQALVSLGSLYAAGVAIAWRSVAAGGRVVTLPTYRFQRDRYWVESAQRRRRSAGEHPLLGVELRSPAIDQTVFQNTISTSWPAFLDHHRVFGAALMPSPVYLEMALEAAAASGTPAVAVEHFEIREALVVPDDNERIVQIVLDADGGFDIVSRAPDDVAWTLHATGSLSIAPGDDGNGGQGEGDHGDGDELDPDAVRVRCLEHIDGDNYYDRLRQLGLEFGSGFRGLTHVWRRDGEALGKVELPSALSHDGGHYAIHPAMLDACFHLLGAPMASNDDHAALLVGLDRFRLVRPATGWVWSHAVLHRDNPDQAEFTGDIRAYDASGALVAEAIGLHLRRATRESLMRAARRIGDDWTYAVNWVPAAAETSVDVSSGSWIVVGDGGGLGAALCAELDTRGIPNVHTSQFSDAGEAPTDGRRCVVDLSGVVGDADPVDRTAAALATAQAVIAAGGHDRLWVVTRGAQAVNGDHVDPDQAPLWGLGRVIALEHPDHWGGLVDLAPDLGSLEVEAATIVDAITSAADDDQIAIRDGERWVPRLARAAKPSGAPIQLSAHRSYLVTGGLGGLGLQLTRWLASSGAGTIVLTGRNALPARAEWSAASPDSRLADQVAAIVAAEALGARVEIVAVDVADELAMRRLFARFGDDLPPLAGVVHAAAELGEIAVSALTRSDIERMLRPKVAGTKVLHDLTVGIDLDWFVMFSSTTALWGSSGYAHYAAANQFMDALTYRRRAMGLPSLTVDWGTWDEMRVASAEARAGVAGIGLRTMASEQALAFLGGLLGEGDRVHAVVAAVDWSVLKPVFEARRRRPLLGDVDELGSPGRAVSGGRRVAEPELRRQLGEAAGGARHDLVVDFLRREVGRALGTANPQTIDVEQGLFEMGMDSLMSVELKGRLEAELGVKLPSTLTFNYPSISALAGYVLSDVVPEPTASAIADSAEQPAEPNGDLTEDELASMLASRLMKLQ